MHKPYHYWTIPIVTSVNQLSGHIKRNTGYVILETTDAGGHNGIGVGFEDTIEQYKHSKIDKKLTKIIFAGGVRTPEDFIKVLGAGFDAVQMGTLFLLAKETNTNQYFKNLVLNAKQGDVGNVVSPAGLPGKGFVNEGVMLRSLKGIDSPKTDCLDSRVKGCILNCEHLAESAKVAGIDNPGDYCLGKALYQAAAKDPVNKKIYPSGALYFCGAEPERLFISEYMKHTNKTSLPAKVIVGKFLCGVFDAILDNKGMEDKHRRFLEYSYSQYQK